MGNGEEGKGRKGLENRIALHRSVVSYNRVVSHLHLHVASTTQHLASWLLLIIFVFSHPTLSFYLTNTLILGVHLC